MKIRDLIGKTITNVFVSYGMQDGWLDTAEMVVELEGIGTIAIPYAFEDWEEEVWQREISSEMHAENLHGTWRWVRGAQIVGLIAYSDHADKMVLQLDNEMLLMEVLMVPHGAGPAGPRCFDRLSDMTEFYGNDFRHFTG